MRHSASVTDGKRAPLTAISLQAVGSPKEAPPTYIAKMWLLKKLGKNVIFSQNHTETNSDDWTITKKTTRTIKHENFAKMKILKVDRWALSLKRPCDNKKICEHPGKLVTLGLLDLLVDQLHRKRKDAKAGQIERGISRRLWLFTLCWIVHKQFNRGGMSAMHPVL